MPSLARVTKAWMLVGTRRSSCASGRATKIRRASKSNASDASVATPIVAWASGVVIGATMSGWTRARARTTPAQSMASRAMTDKGNEASAGTRPLGAAAERARAGANAASASASSRCHPRRTRSPKWSTGATATRVASAASAHKAPAMISVAASPPGTGTVPESNAKTDHDDETDSREGGREIAGTSEDSRTSRGPDVPRDEGAPGAPTCRRELAGPFGSPFGCRTWPGPVDGGKVREPHRPSVRDERNAEVTGCDADVAERPYAQRGAIAQDRRDTGVAGGRRFTRDEEVQAITAGTMQIQRRVVSPTESTLDRADGRVTHRLDEVVDGVRCEYRPCFEQDEDCIVVNVRGERGDRRGHTVGTGHHDRAADAGREVGDRDPTGRLAASVVDEHHARERWIERQDTALERVLGATRAEHRNDRRGSRPVVRTRRRLTGRTGPEKKCAETDPGEELDDEQSARGQRRGLDHGRDAPDQIRDDTDREQRKPSSRHMEGPLLPRGLTVVRPKADITAARC